MSIITTRSEDLFGFRLDLIQDKEDRNYFRVALFRRNARLQNHECISWQEADDLFDAILETVRNVCVFNGI